MNGIIQCVTSKGLLSLSIMCPRPSHTAAGISTSLVFIAKEDSIVGIDHVLSVHSSVDGHLGHRYFLATVTDAAEFLCGHVFTAQREV